MTNQKRLIGRWLLPWQRLHEPNKGGKRVRRKNKRKVKRAEQRSWRHCIWDEGW